MSNLTLSIGAAAVFDTAADTPPIRKSTIKAPGPFSAGACAVIGDTDDKAANPDVCSPPLRLIPVAE